MSLDNSTLPEFRAVELNTRVLASLQRVANTEGDTMSQVSLASLSFGILSILVGTSVYVLISRGSTAQNNGRILLLGTIILYTSTVTYMVALIWSWKNRNHFVTTANNGLFSPLYNGGDESAALEYAIHQQSWIVTIALGVNFVIGDAIIWWRACAIWQWNKVVACIGPILIFVAIGNIRGTASLILSFATNVLATTLIGYKAWQHRRLLKQHFTEGRTSSQVLKALALLTESGCIYCAILTFFLVYEADPTSLTGPNEAFETVANDFEYGCLVPLVAIYPATIIAIVALKQSPIDAGGLSRANRIHRGGSGAAGDTTGASSTVVFRHSTIRPASTALGDAQDATEEALAAVHLGNVPSLEVSTIEEKITLKADSLV